MSEFDFRHPEHFTTGAVGPPGQRVFYLQVGQDGELVTFRLEKQQVLALAEGLEQLMADLATDPVDPPDLDELREPLVTEWVVGAIGLGYDETDDRLLVAVEEFPSEDEEEEPDDLLDEDGPATARVFITRTQASTFIRGARELAEAGRPTCLFCGHPKDPDGHRCPRMN